MHHYRNRALQIILRWPSCKPLSRWQFGDQFVDDRYRVNAPLVAEGVRSTVNMKELVIVAEVAPKIIAAPELCLKRCCTFLEFLRSQLAFNGDPLVRRHHRGNVAGRKSLGQSRFHNLKN